MSQGNDVQTYAKQGFGNQFELKAPVGLLIIDFVNGFADPEVFGGGNIKEAIQNTVPLLAEARKRGWPVAHTRIVFADDGADNNIFSLKVPSMLGLKEDHPVVACVPAWLTPCSGAFAHWCCLIAWVTAPWGRTTRTCSTWNKNTPP